MSWSTDTTFRLWGVEKMLRDILLQGEAMSKELDDLKTAVARNHDAVASAVTAFQGIADQIRAARDDPQALEELANEVSADAAALGAAIVAGTPVAPPAAPAP